MSDDLLGFFCNMSNEGCKIEGSHCIGDQCNTYTGNLNPDDFWVFELTSQDGKTTKVETNLVNCYEPRICFNIIDNQGTKIPLEVSPQDCKIAKDNSLLEIYKSNQGHTFEIKIQKA